MTKLFFQQTLDAIPDVVLSKFVERMMNEGQTENHWFEVKSRLPNRQIKKKSKLLSSISNSGGGLIYYGWNEEDQKFVDIDLDYIQQHLVAESNRCKPSVQIKFRAIYQNGMPGLFVGIPANPTLVMDKKNNYFYRSGSHIRPINEESNYVKNTSHLEQQQSGHLYLELLLEIISEILLEELENKLNYFSSFLDNVKEAVIEDIRDNWKINFKPWFNLNPEWPLRVRFQKWIPPKNETISHQVQMKIINEIETIIEQLNLIDNISEKKIDFTEFRKILRDERIRDDLKNPSGARRCLFTLIIRENIWNFTHAKIFVDKVENGFILFQDSSGSQFVDTIAQLDSFDRDHIQDVITDITKSNYIRNFNKLSNKIKLQIQQITNKIHIRLNQN